MSWVMRKVAHCDECGAEWWAKGEYPKQCPNRECRSRKWNRSVLVGDGRDTVRAEVKRGDSDAGKAPYTRPSDDVGEQASLVRGEKCWCGAALIEWVNPVTMVNKWKCVGAPSHILTPKGNK